MNLSFHRYELKGLKSPRHGALLRVQFPEGNWGVADLHPWPELGDQTLEEQLNNLAAGKLSQQVKCSLAFASLDAQARKNQINLLSNETIPQSHLLVADLKTFQISQATPYPFIKIKLGLDLPHEIPLLKHLLAQRAGVRLDFNERLTFAFFQQFLEQIHLSSIDFIEDPFPYEPEQWETIQQKFPVFLACDRQSERALHFPQSAAILVHKPAVQDLNIFSKIPQTQKLVITSYLDHPIGQLSAAYVAAQLSKKLPGQVLACGFLSHMAYQSDKFSKCLSHHHGQLLPVEGYGFGFDTLLESITWTTL